MDRQDDSTSCANHSLIAIEYRLFAYKGQHRFTTLSASHTAVMQQYSFINITYTFPVCKEQRVSKLRQQHMTRLPHSLLVQYAHRITHQPNRTACNSLHWMRLHPATIPF